MRDVAKRCGVSAMTVSAVLNNRAGEVSPATRRRVLQAMEDMSYQPNAIARGLSRRRMNTLGIVMAYGESLFLANHSYLTPVLDGVFFANRQHHQKTLVIAEDSWQDAEQNLPVYLDGHCDGLVFILSTAPATMFQALIRRRFPFIVVGEDRPEPSIPILDLDNVAAGYEATRYLIGQGHRHIGLLRGDDFFVSSSQREAGFRRALVEAGIPVEARWILPGHYSIDSGLERAQSLLRGRQGDTPTAIFCSDDSIAVGAYRAALGLGLDVPRDVSIVGVNDDHLASEVAPGLTTVRQPFRQFGVRAVEMVLSQIDTKRVSDEKLRLPGELIVRGSVAAPPPARG